ncbi:MAG: hypothetical protein HJHJAOHD_02513 [Flavobacteriales bacterium]|nr:hypothetical protein [Flavobacteriales bacterium]
MILEQKILPFIMGVLVICMWSIGSNSYATCTENNKYRLHLQKDSNNNTVRIILLANNHAIDSVDIKKVQTDTDSLIQLHDSAWHYIYKRKVEHTRLVYDQLVIEPLNNRLVFSFVGMYHYSFQPSEDFKYGYFWDKNTCLFINDSLTQPHIRYTKYAMEIEEKYATYDTLRYIHYLNYNPQLKIYYTHIDTLDGEYFCEFKDCGFKYAKFNKELVYAIQTGERRLGWYLFYKGTWFIINDQYSKSITPFFRPKKID